MYNNYTNQQLKLDVELLFLYGFFRSKFNRTLYSLIAHHLGCFTRNHLEKSTGKEI